MRNDADGNFSGRHLVVFGCGYVGAVIAREGLVRGMHVTALTRNAAQASLLRAEGINAVVADLAGDAWHEHIPSAPDFAVDCVSSGGSGLEGYRRSYVEGMASILSWARVRGAIGTLVFTSSTSVYPQGDGARVDESSATTEAGARGRIMVEAEQCVRAGGSATGRWFILRLAGIYGPGRHHLLEQVRTGVIAGRGTHRLNLAHRDDIAGAVWACFAAPPAVRNEIFNVADDAPATKAEVVAWLAARLGVAPPRFTGEPHAARAVVTPDRVIGNAKLKQQLGWCPRFPTFRAGYEKLLSP